MSTATMNEMDRLRQERDAIQQQLDAAIEREAALAAHVDRLDSELQEKALTDDGVLADAYWNCADMITPWLGEKTGPDTLINSVSGSLEFLIQQWREKKTLEQEREKCDLIKQAEGVEDAIRQFSVKGLQGEYCWTDALRQLAAELRQRAAAL